MIAARWRFALEMQQVRYFVTLANTLNFTRAAEQCNITQPVLTRAIKALEAEFGGELIRREGKTTHLTELGKNMLPLLKQCYESAQSAKSVARSVASGETRSLELGLSRTVDLTLLREALAELFRTFPNLRLKLRRGTGKEVVELLKAGDIELGIAGPIAAHWDRLDEWPMFSESFEVLVGSAHPLASRNGESIGLDALREHIFLVQTGSEMADEERSSLSACGISLDKAHQIDSERDLAELVEANMGVALAPMSMLRSTRLARYSMPDVGLRRTVALYSVAGRARSPEAAAFLSLMRTMDWAEQLH
ncbi:MAG: LysR family transcriptional regulator [Asticcacaulis sp.]|nr:LysR family transcriptional regulator [Asticcacaulis sp.]